MKCFRDMRISRGNSCGCWDSGSSRLDFNQHIAVFDLQWIDRNFRAGILLGCAGFWIPCPAMPRAHDSSTFDHSLPQRAAAMEADVVHGAVDAVDVRDADGFRAAGKFSGFVGGREGGFWGELCEVWHGLWRLQAELRSADGRERPSPHKLFGLQGLRDHYLAFEVLQHIRIETDFCGLLR